MKICTCLCNSCDEAKKIQKFYVSMHDVSIVFTYLQTEGENARCLQLQPLAS